MLVGFGTKHLLDRVVRPFVQREGGKFWEPYLPDGRHVEQFDQTIWPNFNMNDFQKEKHDVAVFGILRGTETWLWYCKRLGLNYYYFDHAYLFKADKHRPNNTSKLLSYRITKNAENLTKIVDLDDEDKDRILKYRKFSETLRIKKIPKGDHILIIPPTEAVCRYYKIYSLENWERQVKEKVSQWSDREFIVRPKTLDTPLEKDLQNAHCVITYQSTVGITATLKGIPVICDDVSMCKPISIKYEDIEKPHIINEELTNKWIDSLLANQFTLQEIENGTAKRVVEKYA